MAKNKKNLSVKDLKTAGITKKMDITKEMNLVETLQKYPEIAEVFFTHGLHCFGCAAAHFESIEQGCTAHGIDADKLVEDLNKAVKASKKQKSRDEELEEEVEKTAGEYAQNKDNEEDINEDYKKN